MTITAQVANASVQAMTITFDGFFVNFMFFCVGLAALSVCCWTIHIPSDKENRR